MDIPTARKPYPIDLSDQHWEIVAIMLPMAKPCGRPQEVNLRNVVDSICYGTARDVCGLF